jgi:hypothetical protein
VNAEAGEFAVDAAVAPRRVLASESDDRGARFGDGGGPPDPVRVGPVVGDEASVPTQQRVGLHEEDGPAVTADRARERGKDRAVVGFETRTRDLSVQYSELVAQHEDLDIFGTIRAAA